MKVTDLVGWIALLIFVFAVSLAPKVGLHQVRVYDAESGILLYENGEYDKVQVDIMDHIVNVYLSNDK